MKSVSDTTEQKILDAAKDAFMKNAMVVRMPNITNIVYGRDVGYKIERVTLDAETENISATEKRRKMGI